MIAAEIAYMINLGHAFATSLWIILAIDQRFFRHHPLESIEFDDYDVRQARISVLNALGHVQDVTFPGAEYYDGWPLSMLVDEYTNLGYTCRSDSAAEISSSDI